MVLRGNCGLLTLYIFTQYSCLFHTLFESRRIIALFLINARGNLLIANYICSMENLLSSIKPFFIKVSYCFFYLL